MDRRHHQCYKYVYTPHIVLSAVVTVRFPIFFQALSTSVAIPNPSLHESQVFSPYSPFFNHHNGPHAPQQAQVHHLKMPSSPPGFAGMMDPRDSPPLPHPPTMLHPALLVQQPQGKRTIRLSSMTESNQSHAIANPLLYHLQTVFFSIFLQIMLIFGPLWITIMTEIRIVIRLTSAMMDYNLLYPFQTTGNAQQTN